MARKPLTPFGVALAKIRVDLGINQAQMATDLGMSPAMFSQAARGVKNWPKNIEFWRLKFNEKYGVELPEISLFRPYTDSYRLNWLLSVYMGTCRKRTFETREELDALIDSYN
jgi:transcriptional regulator with XRE-family HTH domain